LDSFPQNERPDQGIKTIAVFQDAASHGKGWRCNELKPQKYYFDINARFYPFTRRMRWGPSAGKNCENVNALDILACLRSKPPFTGDPETPEFSNCQTDVRDAAQGCCLEPPPALTILPYEIYFPT
jgi:hypothetical protein